MPEIGTIKRGWDIGKGRGRDYYIWYACIDCGKKRWVSSDIGTKGGKK